MRVHVVASGLVVSRRPAPPLGLERRFDHTSWTFEIGRPGEPVDPALVGAANDFLEGVAPQTRRTARVLTPGRPAATADESGGPRSDPVPVRPPSLPPSPSPVLTSTTGPAPVAEPVRPVPTAAPAAPELIPDAVPPADERIPETALRVTERGSTAAEQARFAAASGEEFTEALAAVNAAMATWPALRGDDRGSAKADLAAVWLYLSGRAGTRAAVVDDAVRQGREGAVAGHLPCMVSGLRRLPVHRRPVLRQGSEEVGSEQGTPGRLLGEPSFLTASTDLDVTVANARYDVLIMPATARRTAELASGAAVAEAVFPAGSRYRTLGLRTRDDLPTDGEPTAPRVALLLRELSPDEEPNTAEELDARDRAALSRLERALARRRRAALRVLEEPAAVARLTRRIALITPDEAAARPHVTGPEPERSCAAVVADAGR